VSAHDAEMSAPLEEPVDDDDDSGDDDDLLLCSASLMTSEADLS
jgi:hypothetical protein